MKKHQPRNSVYGFKCKDCRKFVYLGFDNRDMELGGTSAVCQDCAKNYKFRDEAEVSKYE